MFLLKGTIRHFSFRLEILNVTKIKVMEMLDHFTTRENSEMQNAVEQE